MHSIVPVMTLDQKMLSKHYLDLRTSCNFPAIAGVMSLRVVFGKEVPGKNTIDPLFRPEIKLVLG